MEIRRGRLTYRDARTGKDMRLDLERVSAEAESYSAPLGIEAEGAWNGNPVSISGAVDSLADMASGAPVGIDFEARALGFDARLAGTVSGPGLDLRITLRGAELSSLAPLAGQQLPKLGPVALDARIEGSANEFRLEDLKVALASNTLSGRVELAVAGPRPRIGGTLASTGIDLAALRADSSGSTRSAATGGNTESRKERPDRVFPDDPFPLDGLKTVDLDLTFSVEKLAGLSVPVDAVRAGVSLDDGALAVKPFSATVAGSRVEGGFRIDARRAAPGIHLAARAAEVDLGRLLQEAGVTDLFEGKANASVDLSGAGRSVAALMAGLNGDIRIVGGSGRLKTQTFDAAVGGASALLGTLFAGRKQWTVVNCTVASVGIEKGRATSRAALIDTEYSTVAARGTADLASETLDLVVEPRAKSATLNIAVPVHVRGSFAEPKIRPETGAVLKKLGGLAAIALFPPAAIVGLGELGGDDNECLKTAAAGPNSGVAANPVRASPEKAVRELEDKLKGTVKDIGRGLKGLFDRKKD